MDQTFVPWPMIWVTAAAALVIALAFFGREKK